MVWQRAEFSQLFRQVGIIHDAICLSHTPSTLIFTQSPLQPCFLNSTHTKQHVWMDWAWVIAMVSSSLGKVQFLPSSISYITITSTALFIPSFFTSFILASLGCFISSSTVRDKSLSICTKASLKGLDQHCRLCKVCCWLAKKSWMRGRDDDGRNGSKILVHWIREVSNSYQQLLKVVFLIIFIKGVSNWRVMSSTAINKWMGIPLMMINGHGASYFDIRPLQTKDRSRHATICVWLFYDPIMSQRLSIDTTSSDSKMPGCKNITFQFFTSTPNPANTPNPFIYSFDYYSILSSICILSYFIYSSFSSIIYPPFFPDNFSNNLSGRLFLKSFLYYQIYDGFIECNCFQFSQLIFSCSLQSSVDDSKD